MNLLRYDVDEVGAGGQHQSNSDTQRSFEERNVAAHAEPVGGQDRESASVSDGMKGEEEFKGSSYNFSFPFTSIMGLSLSLSISLSLSQCLFDMPF